MTKSQKKLVGYAPVRHSRKSGSKNDTHDTKTQKRNPKSKSVKTSHGSKSHKNVESEEKHASKPHKAHHNNSTKETKHKHKHTRKEQPGSLLLKKAGHPGGLKNVHVPTLPKQSSQLVKRDLLKEINFVDNEITNLDNLVEWASSVVLEKIQVDIAVLSSGSEISAVAPPVDHIDCSNTLEKLKEDVESVIKALSGIADNEIAIRTQQTLNNIKYSRRRIAYLRMWTDQTQATKTRQLAKLLNETYNFGVNVVQTLWKIHGLDTALVQAVEAENGVENPNSFLYATDLLTSMPFFKTTHHHELKVDVETITSLIEPRMDLIGKIIRVKFKTLLSDDYPETTYPAEWSKLVKESMTFIQPAPLETKKSKLGTDKKIEPLSKIVASRLLELIEKVDGQLTHSPKEDGKDGKDKKYEKDKKDAMVVELMKMPSESYLKFFFKSEEAWRSFNRMKETIRKDIEKLSKEVETTNYDMQVCTRLLFASVGYMYFAQQIHNRNYRTVGGPLHYNKKPHPTITSSSINRFFTQPFVWIQKIITSDNVLFMNNVSNTSLYSNLCKAITVSNVFHLTVDLYEKQMQTWKLQVEEKKRQLEQDEDERKLEHESAREREHSHKLELQRVRNSTVLNHYYNQNEDQPKMFPKRNDPSSIDFKSFNEKKRHTALDVPKLEKQPSAPAAANTGNRPIKTCGHVSANEQSHTCKCYFVSCSDCVDDHNEACIIHMLA